MTPRRIGLAAIVAGTAAYAALLVPAIGTHVPGWLVPAVITAGVVGVVMVLAAPVVRGSVNFAAALGVALAAVLVAPAVALAELAGHHQGALDTPFEPLAAARAQADATANLTRIRQVTAPRLEDAALGHPDLAATQTSAAAAAFIYVTGKEVLPIGGFTGTIPEPTVSQLLTDIRDRKFRVLIAFNTGDPRLAQVAAASARSLAPPTYICGSLGTAPGLASRPGQSGLEVQAQGERRLG